MYSNRPRRRRPSRRDAGPELGPTPEVAPNLEEPDKEEPYQRVAAPPNRVAEPLPPPSPRFAGQRTTAARASGKPSSGIEPIGPPERLSAAGWAGEQGALGLRAVASDQSCKPPVAQAAVRNTAEVCGQVTYGGAARGDAVLVGLFSADQSGSLEYWVEVDGPGPYVLDGIRAGRYELHACLCTAVSESGFPKDILATGLWNGGRQFSVAPGDVLDHRDVELFDEIPRGLLQGVDTVFYDVTDLEAAVSFYKGTLGLPLTLKERSWAEFDTGSSILALRRRPQTALVFPPVRRGTEAGGAIVVFRVQNLEAVRRELAHRGVKFVGRVIDIPEARWTTFQDPDGNRMQLFERKR